MKCPFCSLDMDYKNVIHAINNRVGYYCPFCDIHSVFENNILESYMFKILIDDDMFFFLCYIKKNKTIIAKNQEPITSLDCLLTPNEAKKKLKTILTFL